MNNTDSTTQGDAPSISPSRISRKRTCYHGLSAEQRFWKYVDKSAGPDACWPWIGGQDQAGYGSFHLSYINGKQTVIGAHRYSLILAIGPIPDGLVAMHSCDNPICVNPAHLSAGTPLDNMQDALQKGRLFKLQLDSKTLKRIESMLILGVYQQQICKRLGLSIDVVSEIAHGRHPVYSVARPDRPYRAWLRNEQVAEIKHRIAQGETNTSIAAAFGVDHTAISHIRRGRSHKEVQLPQPENDKSADPPRVKLVSAP